MGLTQIQSMPRRDDGAVGLDSDLEASCVQLADQWIIQLKQRLASGANDQWPGTAARAEPLRQHHIGERVSAVNCLPSVPSVPTKSVSQSNR